jgi:hypothetical protein
VLLYFLKRLSVILFNTRIASYTPLSRSLIYLIPMCSPVAADGGIRGLSVLADGRLALLVSRLYLYGSPSSPKFMANLL